MGDFTPLNALPAVNPSPATRAMPFREDCWSEEATATLIDAWGGRYLELNRGNLRQKDWQAVADAVNSLHGHTKKLRRTDVQCKNRIDTIKKKYKVEKARVCESNGAFVSSWPFFDQLDVLIGLKKEPFTRRSVPGGSGLGMGRAEALEAFSRNGTPPMAIVLHREAEREELPVAVVMPQKRSDAVVDDSYFRRNYSAMAAAAAKGEVDEEEETEDEESEENEEERGEDGVEAREGKAGESDGMKMLAKAIESFGEKYERIELEKLRQTRELEVKRIEVGRDLELQRTQMLYDMQIQIEKLKRDRKKSSGLDKSSGVDVVHNLRCGKL